MSESSLAVTPGSGQNLRTNDRSIGGTTVHEQAVFLAESGRGTYTALATAISAATSGDHLLIIQGDGTNYTRLHRLLVMIRGTNTGVLDLRLLRTSTAGSGGSSVSARAFDSADTTPYAGVCMTDPTSRGTEGDQLLQRALNSGTAGNWVEWTAANGYAKPIIFGTSTANGVCLKVQTGIASVTVDIEAEFIVTSHL